MGPAIVIAGELDRIRRHIDSARRASMGPAIVIAGETVKAAELQVVLTASMGPAIVIAGEDSGGEGGPGADELQWGRRS